MLKPAIPWSVMLETLEKLRDKSVLQFIPSAISPLSSIWSQLSTLSTLRCLQPSASFVRPFDVILASFLKAAYLSFLQPLPRYSSPQSSIDLQSLTSIDRRFLQPGLL